MLRENKSSSASTWAILLVEPKVFVLMEVLLEERKGSSPESIMFQRFYDDTWSVITKIEFCACCIVNDGRGEAAIA